MTDKVTQAVFNNYARDLKLKSPTDINELRTLINKVMQGETMQKAKRTAIYNEVNRVEEKKVVPEKKPL